MDINKNLQMDISNEKTWDSSMSEDKNIPVKIHSNLKFTGKVFKSKFLIPHTPIVEYYISYKEPNTIYGDAQRLGWKISKNSVVVEEQRRHREFLTRHELFKPIICMIPKEFWQVTEEYKDRLGYPVMALLPDLYTFLWNMYNCFFTAEGFWAIDWDTVMKTLGELWTHAEWRDRVIAKEQQ